MGSAGPGAVGAEVDCSLSVELSRSLVGLVMESARACRVPLSMRRLASSLVSSTGAEATNSSQLTLNWRLKRELKGLKSKRARGAARAAGLPREFHGELRELSPLVEEI